MNWFDLVVFILAIIALIRGFISGLVMQIAGLAGIILGAVFAGKLSEVIAPRLIVLTHRSAHLIGPLSYIVSFIIILLLIHLLGRLIQSFVKVIKMGTLSRFCGAVFCCAKWLVILSILFNLLIEFDQKCVLINKDIRQHAYAYPVMIKTAQTVIPYLSFTWHSVHT